MSDSMSRKGDSAYSNGTGTKENIRAIEQDIERHQRDIDGLYAKINTVGRANWQIILSGVGVTAALMASLWTLTVSPINKEVERLERGLAAIAGLAGARGITLAELNVKSGQLHERLQRVADEHVSAKEFSVALAASLAHRAELQKQLDALVKKIDDVFPPSKTLEDLTRRLAELERTRVLSGSSPLLR